MNNIKNFVIIAHIDHGKSTLADRFLELTGTLDRAKIKEQHLDSMDLEREKGITIKMQPVRMNYKNLILNLIDTPGHVDFSYEVSRSLAAVEGAILLIDAIKGIQAQTLYNLELAKKQNLIIIPVINKIDLPNAETEKVANDISSLLNINKNEIIKISAKNGINIDQVLEETAVKVPFAENDIDKPFQALIFDSKYDPFKGVIAYIRVTQGKLKKGEKIHLMAVNSSGDAKEIGYFRPDLVEAQELLAGEIGYIATGIKEPGKIRIGDTIIKKDSLNSDNLKPLPGYKEPKPVVFISIYPENADELEDLRNGLEKLRLNDPALTFNPEYKEALGRGFLCGFLGSLHAEIITERLQREFDLDLIISSPSVIFKIINNENEEIMIRSASDWPKDLTSIKQSLEPWIKIEIMTPLIFLGKMTETIQSFEVNYLGENYFGQDKILLIYEMPLREMISGFYNKLLSASQGYSSINYEILGFRESELVKLEILIAGKKEEAFSKIVPQSKAYQEGNFLVKKLKDVLPPQQFIVPLQAVVSGRIISRENVKARRKDVTGHLYGGDYSRKRKLLEKQKKGKKKLQEKTKIKIPTNVYFELMKK